MLALRDSCTKLFHRHKIVKWVNGIYYRYFNFILRFLSCFSSNLIVDVAVVAVV